MDQWVRTMQARGMSQRTVEERRLVLLRFKDHAGVDPAQAGPDHIEDWLLANRRWSASTRATYFSAVHSYMTWAVQRGLREDDPCVVVGKPKAPQGRPKPISSDALRRLFDAARTDRMRAYLTLAAMQGLRVSEIAKVRGEDVDLEGGWIDVVGKGGRDDRLPLNPRTVQVAVRMPTRGWWFPSPKGGHVTGNNVSNVIGKHMRANGVNGTAHQLRHWYATQLVRDGVNVRVVQQLMRHSSLATTGRYAGVGDDLLVAASQGLSLPPVSGERVAGQPDIGRVGG